MERREELALDPECERCSAAIVDQRSAVLSDGKTYCCANCARADVGEERLTPLQGAACSRCGAAIVDRSYAVTEQVNLFCCANCSAAGVSAEPLPEA